MSQEDIIIENIKIIIKGVINEFKLNQINEEWKDSVNYFEQIKFSKKDFYIKLNWWLTQTEYILGTNNNEILKLLAKNYLWIYNLLNIKKIVNFQEI